jgi:hypothetical protein
VENPSSWRVLAMFLCAVIRLCKCLLNTQPLSVLYRSSSRLHPGLCGPGISISYTARKSSCVLGYERYRPYGRVSARTSVVLKGQSRASARVTDED